MSATTRHPSMAPLSYDGRSQPTPRPLMSDQRTLLHQTADLAADFLEGLPSRPVRASASHEELVASMGGALPERGEAAGEIVDHLATIADPGLIARAGPCLRPDARPGAEPRSPRCGRWAGPDAGGRSPGDARRRQ